MKKICSKSKIEILYVCILEIESVHKSTLAVPNIFLQIL